MSPLKVTGKRRHTCTGNGALPVSRKVRDTRSLHPIRLRLVRVGEVHNRWTSLLAAHPAGNRGLLDLHLHFLGDRVVLLSLALLCHG